MADLWPFPFAHSSLFLLSVLLSLILTSVNGERVSWIGYSLSPSSDIKPQILGQVVYEKHANGSSTASWRSWTPPTTLEAAAEVITLGLVADKTKLKGFDSNTIQVSSDLLADTNAMLTLLLDESNDDKLWALRLSISPTSFTSLPGQSGGASSSSKQSRTAGSFPSEPKLTVSGASRPPVPHANKPVVVSPEGKVQAPPPEKTLFQKYWWVLLAITFVLMSGGGEGK